jgi:sulfate transport system ATP-binding protein
VTSVFVTHDQEEALEVADRVVVMNEGRVEQVGTPDEVYHHPVNAFVYNFLGNVNLFHARVEEGRAYIGGMVVDLPEHAQADAETALVYVRPHLLEIDHLPNGGNNFRARVEHINPAGPLVKVELVSEWGDPVQVEISQERYRALRLQKGAEVFITPKEQKVFADNYSI